MRRSQVFMWMRRVGLAILSVLIVEYAAVHLLPDARRSWAAIGGAASVLLGVALLLELGSIGSYSGMTRALVPALVPADKRPSYRSLLAIDVTGLGASHVIPGGGAAAAALRVRLLSQAGVGASEAVALGALEYAMTLLWLVAVLFTGFVVALPHPATGTIVRTALVVAVVLTMAFGALVAVLMQRPDQVVTVTHAVGRRLPWVRPQVVEQLVRSLISQIELVRGSPARTRGAVLFGLGNWALDAASLYVCVLAFGFAPNPGGLMSTYALVGLLALLPLTPGGIGLVEGVAVPALVSFGTPAGAALLGVLAWRLFEFWLPIPVGLAAYVWHRYDNRK